MITFDELKAAFTDTHSKATIDGYPIDKQMLSDMFDGLYSQGCFFCGKVPIGVGAFLPEDPVRYGGVKNKSRQIYYMLCAEHPPGEWTEARFEKIIREEMRF